MKQSARDVLHPLRRKGGFFAPHLLTAGALVKAALFAAGLLSGIVGTRTVEHFTSHGGMIPPRHLPPPTHVKLGGIVPNAWSLDGYVQSVRNQGSSNSCVGQTIAGITDIEAAERGVHQTFSAGFIYDQVNGGVDGGTTYQQAFDLLASQGDAPTWAFSGDGTDWWVQPDWSAHVAAYPWRSRTWHYIQVSDRATIQYFISHGMPVAFAAPWFDSWIQHYYDGSALPYPYGVQRFWHSTILDAYSPYGVLLLNSWSGAYGNNGRVWISWDLLSYMQGLGAFAAVSDTVYPHPAPPKPKPILSSAKVKVWNQYRKEHHKKLVPYAAHHKLRWFTHLWSQADWKHAGGVTRDEEWLPHRRVMKEYTQGFYAYWWPAHKRWGVHWVRRKYWQR